MGTEKRERKKANRAARLAAEQAAETRRRRLIFIRNAVILGVAIVIVGILLAGCGSDDGDGADGGTGSGEVANGDEGSDEAASDRSDEVGADGSAGCPPAGGAPDRRIEFSEPFEDCIDPSNTYTAIFETTHGTITVALDTERTPETVNNFVALARYGYYDGTDLFRVIPGSGIVQGGSPHTQDNSDPGPGYTIDDEGLPFGPDDYGPGALAMARTQAPDSASAQFFFVANENGRYLGEPAQPGGGTYVVFGQATDGLDELAALAELGSNEGIPSEEITVKSVRIDEE